MSKHRQLMLFCTAVLFLVLFSLTTGVQAQEEPRSPNVPQIEGGRPAEVAEYPSTGVLSSGGLCTSDVITTHVGLTDLHCITKPLQFPKQGPLIGSLSFGHPDKRQQVALPVNAYMAPILRYQPTTGNTPPRNVDVAIAISNQDLIATRYPITMVAASLTLPRNQLSGISPIAKGFGITKTHGSTPQWLQVYDKPLTWRYPGEADCHQDFARARLACIFENPNNPETDIMLPGDSGGAMVNRLDAHGSVITDTTKQPVIATNTAYMSGTLALVTDLSEPVLNAELRKVIEKVEQYYEKNEVWTVPALPPTVNVSNTVSAKKINTDTFQIIHSLSIAQIDGIDERIYNVYLNTRPAFNLRDCPVQVRVESNVGGHIEEFRGYDGDIKADIIALGDTGVTAATITQTISFKSNAPVRCISSPDLVVNHVFTPTIYADAVVVVPDGRSFPYAIDDLEVPLIALSTLPVTLALEVTPRVHDPEDNNLTLGYKITARSKELATINAVSITLTSNEESNCFYSVSAFADSGGVTTLNSQRLDAEFNVPLEGDSDVPINFGHVINFPDFCGADGTTHHLNIGVTVAYTYEDSTYVSMFSETASIVVKRKTVIFLPLVHR